MIAPWHNFIYLFTLLDTFLLVYNCFYTLLIVLFSYLLLLLDVYLFNTF